MVSKKIPTNIMESLYPWVHEWAQRCLKIKTFNFPRELEKYSLFKNNVCDFLGEPIIYKCDAYTGYTWNFHLNDVVFKIDEAVDIAYIFFIENGYAVDIDLEGLLNDQSVSSNTKEFIIYNLDVFGVFK